MASLTAWHTQGVQPKTGGHADHIKHSLSTPPRRPREGGPHPRPAQTTRRAHMHPSEGPGLHRLGGGACTHGGPEHPAWKGPSALRRTPHSTLQIHPQFLLERAEEQGDCPQRRGACGALDRLQRAPQVGRAQPSCPEHRPSFLYPGLSGGQTRSLRDTDPGGLTPSCKSAGT